MNEAERVVRDGDGNYMSGGPIRPFRKGWAKVLIGPGGLGRMFRVHYWEQDLETVPEVMGDGQGVMIFYIAKCGLFRATTERVPALEGGNWPRCKRCQRAMGEA